MTKHEPDNGEPVAALIVRLSITQLHSLNRRERGELLLDVEEEPEVAVQRATAWAQVRGLDELVPVIERMFRRPPPDSGQVFVINKRNKLLIWVTWPWAAGERGGPTYER